MKLPWLHPRPLAWSTLEELQISSDLQNDIEFLFQAIEEGRDFEISKTWISNFRLQIHKILELGTGAILHQSSVLSRLDKDKFAFTFGQFCQILGRKMPIDLAGNTMKEVADLGAMDSLTAPARGHMTSQDLSFHSDRADLTALACWNPSNKGGEFKVCSSARLLREIELISPKWIALLKKPIPHDLRNEGQTAEGLGYIDLPILTETDDTFILRYIRKFNESIGRLGLTLPNEIRETLDVVDSVLNRPNFAIEQKFSRGMVTIVNNHTTLHGRNSFIDGGGEKRSLIRFWLSSEFTRKLPKSFEPIFHRTDPGAYRGGILSHQATLK